MSASGQRSHMARKTRSAPRMLTRKSCTSATRRVPSVPADPPGPTPRSLCPPACPRPEETAQPGALCARVASEQPARPGACGEGESLRQVVEKERAPAQPGAHDLPAPRGQQVVGLAAEGGPGGVSPGVDQANVR